MTAMPTDQRERARPLRLLVINPNTNPGVTDLVRSVAAEVVRPDTSVTVINPRSGPFSIETDRDREEAIPGVVSLFRKSLPARYDAYAFACFDDIALDECRALTTAPVVGACEAGIAATRAQSNRFGIITTVQTAVPGIRALVEFYADAGDVCTVRAAGIGVANAASRMDSGVEALIDAAVRDAVDLDGAKAILLGSAGLAGRADVLAARFSVPTIDSIAAAIAQAEALARTAPMVAGGSPLGADEVLRTV